MGKGLLLTITAALLVDTGGVLCTRLSASFSSGCRRRGRINVACASAAVPVRSVSRRPAAARSLGVAYDTPASYATVTAFYFITPSALDTDALTGGVTPRLRSWGCRI